MRHPILQSLALAALTLFARAQIPAPEANAKVEIRETITGGFKHPGIGLTKGILENARTQVIAKREPWHSAYQKLAAHPNSAEKVSCRNQSTKDPSKPDSDTFDSRGMEARLKGDADKALRQALMYYFTGRETHRANAMNIIRTWSKLDPKKFRSFPEDHIHASYPVQNLIIAAELMRYTTAPRPSLAWSPADTAAFTGNFVVPAATTFFDRNGHFMNQAGYPMAAAMACHIFTNDRNNYAKRVEWFTVNKDAPNKGWSYSITDLARLVDTHALTGGKVSPPNIQLVEMGRDQAHAGGDVEIFMNISRMLNAQATKVDPVTGTISTKPDAVGPYDFLDDRILAIADHFCRFMLGYDTPWIPTPSDIGPGGEVRQIYPRIADNYRGRIRGLDFWDAHYYYTYQKGVDVAKKAPYYHEAFTKRIVNSDFDWIHIPKEAGGEGARVPQTEQEPAVVEIEQRSTVFDQNAFASSGNGTTFLRVKPADGGTRVAILSCDTDSKTIGMRVRTSGVAEIAMSGFKRPWLLPDTRGEWKQVAYTMAPLERFIDIVYFVVNGAPGCQVDIDTLIRKPDGKLTTPAFTSGNGERCVITYAGAPLRLDFSVRNKAGLVGSLDMPPGAVLDEATGAFRWTPAQAGEHQFVVTATAHETITPSKVRISVTADRRAAVEKIAAAHDPQTAYVTASLNRCKDLHDRLIDSGKEMDDESFSGKLMELQAAFAELQPLTPLLPDGSMDYPKIVASSDIGEQIAHLTDGNDDTFPVHTLAMDFNYIFDFGEGFRFSADAFAMEGRLNFESRTQDTAFFGSNDGKNWQQLTPEITTPPAGMTRVEVDGALRDASFRYLKVQKMSRKSAGLFEPAELRIYGRRHEAR